MILQHKMKTESLETSYDDMIFQELIVDLLIRKLLTAPASNTRQGFFKIQFSYYFFRIFKMFDLIF